jgi:multidrug efflux pump subunit AcrA (membrane-fusion protein)
MANKFISLIAGNGDSVKLRRAQTVAESARIAQEALVNNLKARVNRLEVQLNQLTDLAPESGDSLRPGAGFEATAWVHGVQALQLEIRDAKIALEVAEATYTEWFGEVATQA